MDTGNVVNHSETESKYRLFWSGRFVMKGSSKEAWDVRLVATRERGSPQNPYDILPKRVKEVSNTLP